MFDRESKSLGSITLPSRIVWKAGIADGQKEEAGRCSKLKHIFFGGRHGSIGKRPPFVDSGVCSALHNMLLHDLKQVNFWCIRDYLQNRENLAVC